MTSDPDLEARVQRLEDRAAISELLLSFARALDTRDYATYVENYADGGVLELPDPVKPGATIVLRKEEMLEAVPKSLGRYGATHHLSANHQIRIDGDRASSVSYLQAVHVRAVPTDHWSAGGWYECDYLRTARGWKFSRVRLSAVWLSGTPGPIRPEP
ncbi:MAG: nuclear transport factor 2 family protein [Gammaproteobacteria bacterium]|nr:nuclear transport factor 2 family protein [Gammaproteobacteria bacterium]